MSSKEVVLTAEITPNPNTIKFNVNQPVLENGVADFPTKEVAQGSLLPETLFEIKNVSGVMIGTNFITVTKLEEAEWGDLLSVVADKLKEILTSEKEIISTKIQVNTQSVQGSVEQQIVEILDREIRPAVAMDGGDIVFCGYEEGVVTLHLRGACSSCPSSIMTLKMGVERRLKELIPEIKEVVQVNE